MALRTAGSVLMVFIWSETVVLGQNGWRVTYNPQSICALKRSTVDLSCSYTYPRGHTVTGTSWFYRWSVVKPQNDDRVEYYGDSVNDCTLRITDLRESDSAEYWFTFRTQIIQGHVFQSVRSESYSGSPGVRLSVTEKQASVKNASIGIIVVVLVLILCLSVLMWFRKASKSTSDTRDRRDTVDTVDNGQQDSSPVYDNISGMTHTAAPTVDTDNQDNVQYASIQHRNQEVPEYSTAQPSQPQKQEEDVQYAAVKFNHTSAVDMPVETTGTVHWKHQVLV